MRAGEANRYFRAENEHVGEDSQGVGGESGLVSSQRYNLHRCAIPSFPFKGKVGMGMGLPHILPLFSVSSVARSSIS